MAELYAIVAVCSDWGIGKDGDMVVANRADMRHFVECTMGHPVIMGRRTLESFPGACPLKGRRNIVLTRNTGFAPEGVEVVHSLQEALNAVKNESEAWVIGGGEIYRMFLPYCIGAEITKNHVICPVDTYFPNLDKDQEWELIQQSATAKILPNEGDEGIEYLFCTYRKHKDAY